MKFIPIESMDLIPDNAVIKLQIKDWPEISYQVFRRISKDTVILGSYFLWDVQSSYNFISYVEIIEG